MYHPKTLPWSEVGRRTLSSHTICHQWEGRNTPLAVVSQPLPPWYVLPSPTQSERLSVRRFTQDQHSIGYADTQALSSFLYPDPLSMPLGPLYITLSPSTVAHPPLSLPYSLQVSPS